MNKLLLFLSLFLVSCGGKYIVEVPPIEIDVHHSFSFTEMQQAFTAQCQRELGSDADPSAVQTCSEVKLAIFLQDLEHAISGT